MSTATLVVALAAQPAGIQIGGKEALEAFAATNSKDAANVLLQCHAGSATATALSAKQPNDLLLISGDLALDESGNVPLVYTRVICDANPDQYLNEINIVGRVASEPRVSDTAKSCARTVAVNRYVSGEQQTDWFKVRAYGFAKDKLASAPKGSLVSICGTLEQRVSQKGQSYPEIKARLIKVHGKPKDAPASDPSAGKATGYSAEDFAAPEMPWDWS